MENKENVRVEIDLKNAPAWPVLRDEFFAVVNTAINNTAWKGSHLNLVKATQEQLIALKKFADFFNQQIDKANGKENKENVEEGVELENLPAETPEVPAEEPKPEVKPEEGIPASPENGQPVEDTPKVEPEKKKK